MSEKISAMSTPRPEAIAAAGWWAAKLGHASMRTGNHADPSVRQNEGFAAAVRSVAAPLQVTMAQWSAFARILAENIEAMLCEEWRGWEDAVTKGPEWGSALRTVAADYGQDPAVTAAAEAVGIKLRTWDLPIKTCMWVNPGRVTVAEGYRAETAVVWTAP